MATLAGGALGPLRQSYRFLQRHAHENPAVFYSCVLGAVGPLLVLTVPPIRKSFGYVSPPRPPTTYPLPNRKRDSTLSGYDDE